MPSPASSIAVIRPELAAAFEQFDLEGDRRGFIAQRLLPVFESAVQCAGFPRITVKSLLQNRESRRAPRAGYNRGDYTFEGDTFTTENHGVEELVDDDEARMYANYFDVELLAAVRARDALLRNQEKRAADLIFNATTWTGAALTTAVTNEWDKNHLSDAVPIADVNAACLKVYEGTGLWPNALVINRKVFRNLRTLDEIKEAIASTGAGSQTRARDITVEQLAAVFDLDYILVAGGSKDTANESAALSVAQIWSDEYAMVCRICTTADLIEPGLGRTFHWDQDASDIGGFVESYREESRSSGVIRVRNWVHQKTLYVACGHLLSNITT